MIAQVLLLAAAGLLAGAMNAMAGGGSFASFPALIAAGIPPVTANTSSAVALYPGGLISAWVFRRTNGPVAGVPIRLLGMVTAVGGLAGALLLVTTPAAAFDRIVPWLLLAATLALAFGRRIDFPGEARGGGRALVMGQFLLGAYGGYFGGAAGIMMVAFWTFVAGCDVKDVAAQRTLLVTAANSAAVLFFAATGIVDWGAVLIVAPAALAGGYLGALIGLKLRARHVRVGTVSIAAAVTAIFFLRAYA